jgi:cytochrome c oxidase cbb3-type subunit 2
MSNLYAKPILFTVISAVVILIGTAVTMFYPMLTPEMAPKIEGVRPYTALELAGKDIYQREGCNNCHTQTVRPLRSEVDRYGEYSKAGEFVYDRPFLWGSKRTGPDLARIGGKYPDAWHEKHFARPQDFYPRSNMPAYGWLADRKINPDSIRRNMDVNRFPYTEEEIESLAAKTELDALTAYMQVIGTAVKKSAPPVEVSAPLDGRNPFAGSPDAIHQGEELYEAHCQMCHGYGGTGDIGPEVDEYGGDDADFYEVIAAGIEGEMPSYGNVLESREIWHIVTYLRSLAKETSEPASGGDSGKFNPLADDPEAVEEGGEIYAGRCAMCHGKDLDGGIGPGFLDAQHAGHEDAFYYETITAGREGGMPAFGSQLSQKQVWQVISFIRARQAAR